MINGRMFQCALGILGAVLLVSSLVEAGDLADVKARGKLIMLCYPVQQSNFVAADLDAMRESNLRLADLRKPDQFKGLDVDLIDGFAHSLGVALEIHPVTTGYDGLFPALARQQGDLVASSLTSTPHRLELADFSDPYLTSWVVVAVPRKSRIAAPADLKGKKAAVMHGSSQYELLKSLGLGSTFLLTDFALESYVAVTGGKADFTVMDSPAAVGERVSDVYPNLKVAFRLRDFGYGVAIRKGSDLLAPLNAYIAEAKRSGEMDRTVARYFPTGSGKILTPQP